MKTILLTKGYVAFVDDADYERVSSFNWRAKVGKYTTYAIRSVYVNGSQVTQYLHRFILDVTDRTVKIDHEDHNGLNNQRHNLRPGTNHDNQGNRRKTIGSSRFKGVHWAKRQKRWSVSINSHTGLRHLGYFLDEVEAAKAYDAAAQKHFGAFALLNFPLQKPCEMRNIERVNPRDKIRDMDCSNRDIDPDLRDPLLDTYHAEGALDPGEIKADRPSYFRRKRTFDVDICI